jgi:UDP-N-acetylmuramyl pentapeptide phosphotransferase/UDP-N-acetylglucosamine-1-phosphate transferase
LEESQGASASFVVFCLESLEMRRRLTSSLSQFFMNFLLWSTLYTVYVLVVLVCKLASTPGVDGQMIGVAAA